jgi:tRNA pseudouridine55 synthase
MIDFINGKTILVDKPLGWTSFDVVNKIRWNLKQKLKVKNIKVGHAGTLDPLASGLLVICIGKNTKLIDSMIGQDKAYSGTFLLGKSTPSYDLETEFDAVFEISKIDLSQIDVIVQSFLGEQDQVPPIFSAKQVDGKRAYDYAREGKTLVLPPNRVNIKEFSVDTTNFPEINFKIVCSKGTYIRSLASDFGKKLNSAATLIALRRTASGSFLIDNAKTVEEWISIIKG